MLSTVMLCRDDHLPASGCLFTWGRGSNGQLGLGDRVDRRIPTLVATLSCVNMIACGSLHTLAATDAGLYSWGHGGEGRLGHGCDKHCTRPRKIEGTECLLVHQLQCGGFHTAVLAQVTGGPVLSGHNDAISPTLSTASTQLLSPRSTPEPPQGSAWSVSPFEASPFEASLGGSPSAGSPSAVSRACSSPASFAPLGAAPVVGVVPEDVVSVSAPVTPKRASGALHGWQVAVSRVVNATRSVWCWCLTVCGAGVSRCVV